jgi:hypothetical protein
MKGMSRGARSIAGRDVGYQPDRKHPKRTWGSAGAISGPPQLKSLKN